MEYARFHILVVDGRVNQVVIEINVDVAKLAVVIAEDVSDTFVRLLMLIPSGDVAFADKHASILLHAANVHRLKTDVSDLWSSVCLCKYVYVSVVDGGVDLVGILQYREISMNDIGRAE